MPSVTSNRAIRVGLSGSGTESDRTAVSLWAVSTGIRHGERPTASMQASRVQARGIELNAGFPRLIAAWWGSQYWNRKPTMLTRPITGLKFQNSNAPLSVRLSMVTKPVIQRVTSCVRLALSLTNPG